MSTEYLCLIAIKIVHRSQVVGNIRNNSQECSFIKGLEGYHTVSELILLMLDVILTWRSLLELFIRYLCSVCRMLFAFLKDSCLLFFVFFFGTKSTTKRLCMKCPETSIFQDLLNIKRNLNILLKIMIRNKGSWIVLLSICFDKISTPVNLPNHSILMLSESKIGYLKLYRTVQFKLP